MLPVRWSQKALPQQLGPWLSSLPVHEQTELEGQQNSRFRDPNWADLPPDRVLWSECAPSLVPQVIKAAVWDYYLGTAGVNSLSRSVCWLLLPFPSSLQSEAQWLSSVGSPEFLMMSDQSRGFPKWPTMLREAGSPPGFSLPTGGTRASREISTRVAALAWGRGNVVTV